MNALVLLIALSGEPPATAESVIAELQRPGCPALFERLTPTFQDSAPKRTWGDFCAAFAKNGALKKIGAPKVSSGFSVYVVQLEKADVELGLAFDESGHISGLYVKPSTHAEDGHVHYHWPLNKPTLVFWGGADAASNQHVSVPRQQRATDLTIVGEDGADHSGDGKKNTDYLGFGAQVLAAADGKVLVAVDGVPENEPGAMDNTLTPGNVIEIEHAPGEYGQYCHLQPGSLKVKAGDTVKAGQVIGLLGNTGNSSQPHLHFHVQSSSKMAEGVGLDPLFEGVCLKDGKAPLAQYRLHKGDVIVPCPKR